MRATELQDENAALQRSLRAAQVPEFTGFTGTKKYAAELQDENAALQRSLRARAEVLLKFTSCFTGTKVQTLTHCARQERVAVTSLLKFTTGFYWCQSTNTDALRKQKVQTLTYSSLLLVLLVPKCKF